MDDGRPAPAAGADPAALVPASAAASAAPAVAGTPAGLLRRTAAAAIDTALLSVEFTVMFLVVAVVATIAVGGPSDTTAEVPMGPSLTAAVMIQLVFSWLYSVLLQTSPWQATIGMRLAGLEVTDLEGRRLSFARATARYAAKRLVALTLYAGFFMLAITERRQALHDVLAGTVVVRRGQAPAPAAAAFDTDLMRRALDRAFVLSRDRLPADLHARVAAIRLKILELLPETRLFPMGSRDLFVLQRTAIDYLPTSVDDYLALPPGYATTSVLPDGRTALQVLRDQLELLDWKMTEIGDALRQADSERLLAHGRFLEESFGRPSEGLSLPPERP